MVDGLQKFYGNGTTILYKPGMSDKQVMFADACGGKSETSVDFPSAFVDYYDNSFKKLKETFTMEEKCYLEKIGNFFYFISTKLMTHLHFHYHFQMKEHIFRVIE